MDCCISTMNWGSKALSGTRRRPSSNSSTLPTSNAHTTQKAAPPHSAQMRILSKKNNHLLQSLSSNLKFKLNTYCSRVRVRNNPSLYLSNSKDRHLHLKTADGDRNRLLLKHLLDKPTKSGSKYEFSLLTPENFSSLNHLRFEIRLLERYAEFAPSCNGLLYVYNKCGDAAIWNPSTEKSIELPSHRKADTTIVDACALGFDSKSQDYRVVRFVDNCIGTITPDYRDSEEKVAGSNEDCTTGVELYSFKSNSWKWISDYRDVVYDFCSSSVYLNGCSYWLCSKFILSFDFGDETLCCLDLPETGKILDGRSYVLDLVEFDGSVGAIVYPRSAVECLTKFGARKSFEVWVMDGGGKWSREMIVPASKAGRPMGFWRNGQLFFENERRKDEILAYDLHTDDIIKLDICGHCGNTDFIPYVQTTLPIDEQLGVSRL